MPSSNPVNSTAHSLTEEEGMVVCTGGEKLLLKESCEAKLVQESI